jgi:PIN domain nuclease of toxin-antitoxin system
MTSAILDTSAILATINNEAGSEIVKPLLSNSIVSSVNIAETSAILVSRYKIPLSEVKALINQLIGTVINFTEEQAYIIAELEVINKEHGYDLSLADKACISLGVSMNMAVYTADKVWKELNFKNTNIKLIR